SVRSAPPPRSPAGAKRRPNDLALGAAKHVVETVGEPLVPIADQVADRFWAVGQAPGQLSGLLCHPLCGRGRRAASDMHASAAQFDEEEEVEPLEPVGYRNSDPTHAARRYSWTSPPRQSRRLTTIGFVPAD